MKKIIGLILALALCAGKALAAPADIPWQGRTDIPRETIEWQDTWVEDGALRKKLPRVLLQQLKDSHIFPTP